MDFTQLTDHDVQHMLGEVGVDSVEQLFQGIPDSARLNRPLDLPEPLTETQLMDEMHRLSLANVTCECQRCFLGGGVYDHFIPAVVDDLSSQNEFVTAYTPYQAEVAQGALQAFYEYQTLICQLTGMDVSNASLYEGATSVAEAVLMARGINGRRRVVISSAVHPDTIGVLNTYLRELPIDLVVVESSGGQTNPQDLRQAVNEDTCAVVIQTPNFFGTIEALDQLTAQAHEVGAMAIAAVDPISCGLLKRPGELGVDIVVGDGQSMGIPMFYGGPSLGFMATTKKHMRKLPGRLIGCTTDSVGRRGFCLTLQTREQHIRREKATSNICTNQGLLALRVAIYLSAMGRTGLSKVASLCLDKAHYAAQRISQLEGFELRFKTPFFKEFAVRTNKDVAKVLAHCRERGILAGVELGRWYDHLSDTFLVAVTEKRSGEDIEALVNALDEV